MANARAVFDAFREHVFEQQPERFWAPDVVVEQPFAVGGPSRVEGVDNWLASSKASKESLPVRFEEMRNVVVHDTTDPNKLVVEYELTGTVLTTGKHESAAFIAVMEVRDGLMTLWREYQNTFAIAQALGRLPTMDAY